MGIVTNAARRKAAVQQSGASLSVTSHAHTQTGTQTDSTFKLEGARQPDSQAIQRNARADCMRHPVPRHGQSGGASIQLFLHLPQCGVVVQVEY